MKLPISLVTITPFSKFLALFLFISLPFVGFYFGRYYQQRINSSQTVYLPSNNPPPIVPTAFIESTVVSTNTPSPKPLNIKKLTYSLPTGWQTTTDTTQTLQIGYDPKTNQVVSDSRPLMIFTSPLWQTSPPRPLGYWWSAQIVPYSGGSRHQVIYKIMGVKGPQDSDCESSAFRQTEYTYNGWPCLVLLGLCVSQSPTTSGFCPISPTQGIFFQMEVGINPPNNKLTEQLLSTIRVLK